MGFNETAHGSVSRWQLLANCTHGAEPELINNPNYSKTYSVLINLKLNDDNAIYEYYSILCSLEKQVFDDKCKRIKKRFQNNCFLIFKSTFYVDGISGLVTLLSRLQVVVVRERTSAAINISKIFFL